jgi:hypothetical protein
MDRPAVWPPPTGAVQAMHVCHEDIVKLRSLVGGKLGISKQDTVVHSKEALWRLGQAIESGLEPVWASIMGDTMLCWEAVQGLTRHKLSPAQLQQLYRTMKRQGYQSPGELPGLALRQGIVQEGECVARPAATPSVT